MPFHGSNLADISLTQFLFRWASLLLLRLVSVILESWPKTSVSLTRRDQNQSERPSGLAPKEEKNMTLHFLPNTDIENIAVTILWYFYPFQRLSFILFSYHFQHYFRKYLSPFSISSSIFMFQLYLTDILSNLERESFKLCHYKIPVIQLSLFPF